VTPLIFSFKLIRGNTSTFGLLGAAALGEELDDGEPAGGWPTAKVLFIRPMVSANLR